MAAIPNFPTTMTSDEARVTCQSLLKNFVARVPSISFACLGTVDGRSFAYSGANPDISAQRFSAMTCSLLALSESFSREGLRSNCTHMTVSTEHGTIVVVRVPSRTRAYALSVGADSSDVLAMVLRKTLDAATAIANIVDSAH